MDNKSSSFKQILAEMARRREARRARREAREAIQMDREMPQEEKWCYTCQAMINTVQLCRTRFHHLDGDTMINAHQCENGTGNCTKRGTHLGVIGGPSHQANDSAHESAQEQQMINDQFRR